MSEGVDFASIALNFAPIIADFVSVLTYFTPVFINFASVLSNFTPVLIDSALVGINAAFVSNKFAANHNDAAPVIVKSISVGVNLAFDTANHAFVTIKFAVTSILRAAVKSVYWHETEISHQQRRKSLKSNFEIQSYSASRL